MNMPLIAMLLKLHSRYNPYWTNEKIISLAKKHTNAQQKNISDGQRDRLTETIDNQIMESNLQELLLLDEAKIIKILHDSNQYIDKTEN